MPDIDRGAIRARCEAATPGPWDSYRPHPRYRCYQVERVAPEGHLAGDGAVVACEDVNAAENADFIAHARQDVPALLDALEAAEAEVERLRESNANLRLISNANGDWNLKFLQELGAGLVAMMQYQASAAQTAEAAIERVKALADSWTGERSDIGPVTRAHGAQLRAALSDPEEASSDE